MKTSSILMFLAGLAACSSGTTATEPLVTGSTAPRPTERDAPSPSFVASAPRGFSLNDLGRPFTVDFRRLQGTQGQSLFPKAGAVLRTPQHVFEHDIDTIDTWEEMAANAGAWGIRGGLEQMSASRYASLRVVEIDDVREIDDTTPMRRAPRDAVYYPWRIYMGRSYEVVLEGSVEQFDASVRARLIAFSGDIEHFAREHELEHSVRARGLAPKNDAAIFAKTTEQIETLYRSTIEEPVPILVEWRRIPGRTADRRPITWKELRRGCTGEPGCEPCERWRFSRIEVGIPRRKPDGRAWDADGSPPDVVLNLHAAGDDRTSTLKPTYQRSWTLSPAVIVEANDMLRLRAIDKDLMADDPIFILSARPGGTLRGGMLQLGSGSAVAHGECIDDASVDEPQRKSPRSRRWR